VSNLLVLQDVTQVYAFTKYFIAALRDWGLVLPGLCGLFFPSFFVVLLKLTMSFFTFGLFIALVFC